MSAHPSVVLHDLTFHWPDGTPVMDHVTGAFSRSRTGLVGANGAGKSTLLRLIAGALRPTGGSITVSGTVDHLPQDATRSARTVGDLLGIGPTRRALRAIEAGSVEPTDFAVIGDDWDIEARTRADLGALGLPTDLDRAASTLSGGEAMLIAIAGVRLRGADIVLLDEPTNNLDADARGRLHELIGSWRGTLILASHDRETLDRVDETAELRDGALTTFGGPYGRYMEWLDVQQQAAEHARRSARQVLKRERRERIKAEERIAHSQRKGRRDRENRTFVPAAIDQRRNSAEKAQGARRGRADARVETAEAAVTAAAREVRQDESVDLRLPDPEVPRSRRIAEFPSADGRLHVIRGPERVGLVGPNGVGKTTLLERLLPTVRARVAYLPQRIMMDDEATVLETVRTFAPAMPDGELRDRLARLLIRGDMVDRPVGDLSGGQRVRVALARLLFASPPPELLVLDEPTNDQDIPSVDRLVAALTAYRGALVIVSHDRTVLDRLRLDVILRLDAGGTLTVMRTHDVPPAA